MLERVKNFIEKHIDLIEDNNLELLFQILYADESMYDVESDNLCKALKQAGIEFEEQRMEAVKQILLNDIAAFSRSKDPTIYSMPLKDYVEAFIDNHLGLDINTWIKYVIEHRKDFLTVNIFEENGMWIISRED